MNRPFVLSPACRTHRALGCAILGGAFLWSATLSAQIPGKAQVRGVQGIVSYSDEDGTGMPLKAGTILHPGAIINTEASGSVDIEFDGAAGFIRLLPKTTLTLTQLTMRSAKGGMLGIQLNLATGTILGQTAKALAGSRYEVTTLSGTASINGGVFKIEAPGRVLVAGGTVVFAHAAAAGQPVAHTLHAPPATTFSPEEGVKPAAPTMARELADQLKTKLKKR